MVTDSLEAGPRARVAASSTNAASPTARHKRMSTTHSGRLIQNSPTSSPVTSETAT